MSNDLHDEHRIADAVRAGGSVPTAASRAAMRAALEAAIHDDATTAPIGERRWADHRDSRRRTLVVGLLAAAAAVVTVATIAVIRHDDPRPNVTPVTEPQTSDGSPTTSPPTTAAEPSADPLVEQLRGRWVVTALGADRWPRAALPALEFGDPGPSFLRGFDGCNSYTGTGDVDGSTLQITESGSTTAACTGVTPALPADGDRIDVSDDGATLSLLDAGGVSRLTLSRVDSLTPVAHLDGRYVTDTAVASPVTFTFSDYSRLLDIGFGCSSQWSLQDGDLQVTKDPPQSCAASVPGETADDTAARTMLASEVALQVRTSPQSPSDLLLVSPGEIVHLEALDPPISPDQITLERGAIVGIRAGERITAEQLLAELEPRLGPADLDTGWFTAAVVPSVDGEDCIGGKPYRVLSWGDIFIVLWKTSDDQSQVISWSVGDRRAGLTPDIRSGYTPPPAPASAGGLATELGLQVGTTEAQFRSMYGDRFSSSTSDSPITFDDGTVELLGINGFVSLHPTGIGVDVTVRNGIVTGISGQLLFC